MPEEMQDAEVIAKNLIALKQLITAISLLNEVNNTGTAFTDDILPSCTEQFIIELGSKLNAIGSFLETVVIENNEVVAVD